MLRKALFNGSISMAKVVIKNIPAIEHTEALAYPASAWWEHISTTSISHRFVAVPKFYCTKMVSQIWKMLIAVCGYFVLQAH